MLEENHIHDFNIRLTMEDFEAHKDTLADIDPKFSIDSLAVYSAVPGGYAEYGEGEFICQLFQEELDGLEKDATIKPWEDLTFEQQYKLLNACANLESFILNGELEHITEEEVCSLVTNDYFIVKEDNKEEE